MTQYPNHVERNQQREDAPDGIANIPTQVQNELEARRLTPTSELINRCTASLTEVQRLQTESNNSTDADLVLNDVLLQRVELQSAYIDLSILKTRDGRLQNDQKITINTLLQNYARSLLGHNRTANSTRLSYEGRQTIIDLSRESRLDLDTTPFAVTGGNAAASTNSSLSSRQTNSANASSGSTPPSTTAAQAAPALDAEGQQKGRITNFLDQNFSLIPNCIQQVAPPLYHPRELEGYDPKTKGYCKWELRAAMQISGRYRTNLRALIKRT